MAGMTLRRAAGGMYNRLVAGFDRLVAPVAHRVFFRELVRRTDNFNDIAWLGNPIWQNVLDLWTIQETIADIKPHLLIETGTNRGGSSMFYAHLFDLLGRGDIITIDIKKLHELSHPRITCLVGSSTGDEIAAAVRARAAACRGPVLVILDSDHAEDHVREELDIYAPLVTPGSYCLVQDGVIDTLTIFRRDRPGPLPAIERFLETHPEFEVDLVRCERFLITHHPRGWLQRKRA